MYTEHMEYSIAGFTQLRAPALIANKCFLRRPLILDGPYPNAALNKIILYYTYLSIDRWQLLSSETLTF